MYDSVSNSTTSLGNTTETFFKISNLLVGHNYTFSVRASCLMNGQLCGEAAVLLYDELGSVGAGMCTHKHTHTHCPSSYCFIIALLKLRLVTDRQAGNIFFFFAEEIDLLVCSANSRIPSMMKFFFQLFILCNPVCVISSLHALCTYVGTYYYLDKAALTLKPYLTLPFIFPLYLNHSSK